MRAFLLILVLVAVTCLGWYGGAANRSLPQSADADSKSAVLISQQSQPRSFSSAIRCQGKLLPATGLIKIVAPVGSQISQLTDKSVGDEVSKDEVLATLQGREVRERELKLANARRSDAIKQARIEKDQARFKLSSAELAVDEATATDEKIKVEEQKIDLLRRQLSSHQSMLSRLQQIKSDPSTSRLLNQTDVEKQELVVAQLKLQIEQATLTVAQARSSAGRAKVVAENNVAAVKNGLDNAQNAVPLDSLDAAVELAEAAWRMTQLKSPIPKAKILDIIVREGDSVTNQPVMVIGDTSQMHCIAEVSDQLLRQIDLSTNGELRATISSPAISEALTGAVIAKGVMVGAPSLTDPNPFAKVDRRTGSVTIRLDDSSAAENLVNLQVDVEIELRPEETGRGE